MQTGGMRKGVCAHHSLVRLYRHIHEFAHHPARTVDFLGIDAMRYFEEVFPHGGIHHHLFQRGVPGALADAIYRALYLVHAIQDGDQ